MSSSPVSGLTRRAWSALWYGPSASRATGRGHSGPRYHASSSLPVRSCRVTGTCPVSATPGVPVPISPESSPTASSRNEPPPGRAGAAVNVQLCSSTSRAVAGAAGTASPVRQGMDGTRSVRCSSDTRQARWRCPGAGRRLAITTANQPSLSPAASSRSSTFTRRAWQSSVASSLVGSSRRSSGPGASTASTSGSPPGFSRASTAPSVMTLLSGTWVSTLASGASGSSANTSSASHGASALQRTRLGLVGIRRRRRDQAGRVEVALPGQRPAAEHDVRQDLLEEPHGVARRMDRRDLAGGKREPRPLDREVRVARRQREVPAGDRRGHGQLVRVVLQGRQDGVVELHLAGSGATGIGHVPSTVDSWTTVTLPEAVSGPSAISWRGREPASAPAHSSARPRNPTTPAVTH